MATGTNRPLGKRLVPLHERLRTRRNRSSVSVDDLAERARLNATVISEVEDGQLDPRPSLIEAVAAALSVPATNLIEDLHLTDDQTDGGTPA